MLDKGRWGLVEALVPGGGALGQKILSRSSLGLESGPLTRTSEQKEGGPERPCRQGPWSSVTELCGL